MKRPEEVSLSHEAGEALLERLKGDALTADARCVLGLVLQWYFAARNNPAQVFPFSADNHTGSARSQAAETEAAVIPAGPQSRHRARE